MLGPDSAPQYLYLLRNSALYHLWPILRINANIHIPSSPNLNPSPLTPDPKLTPYHMPKYLEKKNSWI